MKIEKRVLISAFVIVLMLSLGFIFTNSGDMLTGKLKLRPGKIKHGSDSKVLKVEEVATVKYPGCKKVKAYRRYDQDEEINFDGILEVTLSDFIDRAVYDDALWQLSMEAFMADQNFVEDIEVNNIDLPPEDERHYSSYEEVYSNETTFYAVSGWNIEFPWVGLEALLTLSDGRVLKLSGRFLEDVWLGVSITSDIKGDFEFGTANHLDMQNVFAGEAKVNFRLVDAELRYVMARLNPDTYELVRVMPNGSEQELDDPLIETLVELMFNRFSDNTYNFLPPFPVDLLNDYNLMLQDYAEDSELAELSAILLARILLLNAGAFSNVDLVFSKRIQANDDPEDTLPYSYFCDRGKTKQTNINPFLIPPAGRYVENWIDYNF